MGKTVFQFLIGRLKTYVDAAGFGNIDEFQFLIGRLKPINPKKKWWLEKVSIPHR